MLWALNSYSELNLQARKYCFWDDGNAAIFLNNLKQNEQEDHLVVLKYFLEAFQEAKT